MQTWEVVEIILVTMEVIGTSIDEVDSQAFIDSEVELAMEDQVDMVEMGQQEVDQVEMGQQEVGQVEMGQEEMG